MWVSHDSQSLPCTCILVECPVYSEWNGVISSVVACSVTVICSMDEDTSHAMKKSSCSAYDTGFLSPQRSRMLLSWAGTHGSLYQLKYVHWRDDTILFSPVNQGNLYHCSYSTAITIYHLSSEIPGAHLVSTTLQSCVDSVSAPPLCDQIESVYILGGASVYEVRMDSYTVCACVCVCARVWLCLTDH